MNRLIRKTLVWLGAALVPLLLFGCGETDRVGGDASASVGSKAVASEPEFRTIKVAQGEVRIPVKPQRIADISGSTEELLTLGFTPIASGNTDMANASAFTPILKQKLPAGTINTGWYASEVNIEQLVSANPDLILAGPRQEKLYEQLSKIAPTVMVPYDFNAFRERFAFVADTLGKKPEMEAWLKQYDERASELGKTLAAATHNGNFAVIEATAKEIRIYATTGVAGMVFGDLKLPKAPGTPEPDKWGGKVTSLEGLSELDPDHIVLMADSEQNVLQQSKVWSGLKAVKAGNVYKLTTVQNYNEAFTALGKKALLEQLAKDIAGKAKR
ncbi:ABC transporter substrate-binding protein [Paenibacillus hodogayensis]|uniref:ABC transporter substrate-binding protein n=1 Tax=Paenibacillus hodogayensis TaxID=279208 RepID=A0ABV5W3P3_9BACL